MVCLRGRTPLKKKLHVAHTDLIFTKIKTRNQPSAAPSLVYCVHLASTLSKPNGKRKKRLVFSFEAGSRY